MEIECRLFGPFRDSVGTKTLSYETDAADYEELLSDLEQEYPGLDGRLLGEGGVAGGVAITVNRDDIRHGKHLDGAVEDGDIVRLTPSVHGGAGRTGAVVGRRAVRLLDHRLSSGRQR